MILKGGYKGCFTWRFSVLKTHSTVPYSSERERERDRERQRQRETETETERQTVENADTVHNHK